MRNELSADAAAAKLISGMVALSMGLVGSSIMLVSLVMVVGGSGGTLYCDGTERRAPTVNCRELLTVDQVIG